MTGGLHVAGRAMSNFAARHDVISNNLANASTPGFAREDTFLERLEAEGAKPFTGPRVETRTVFVPGDPILTERPLDLLLEGSGFFTVHTARGERYSRLGSLQVDRDGYVRSSDGHLVLGENGLLHVGDRSVTVEKDGSILAAGTFLDRLRITTFARADDLERESGGLYAPRPGRRPDPSLPRPDLQIGQLEGSSVRPIAELVRMIEAVRSYATAARAVRATDNTLQRAVNDIARI
jgi:flagellar basal-body rod protein FlgG